MPATAADIAKYTQDGVTLTYQNDALKAVHANAVDAGEIPTFFRYRADALVLLNERATLLSGVGKFHEAIEVDEVLGVGSDTAVYPVTPTFTVIDATRDINLNARTRSVSLDGPTDRYSVELVG